jgi:RimJ/RimL family protein N-acetyltransferase
VPLHLPTLRTRRLQIIPAGRAWLEASASDAATFAAAAGRPVAPDWPPKEWDAGPVNGLLGKMTDHPDEPFWRSWFVALAADPDDPARPGPIVGTCGTKGPPSASAPPGPPTDGAVEIGYGVVTSRWRRGIATEAAGALCAWCLTDPRVRLLRAHTLPGDPASGGVLRKLGFHLVGEVIEPGDGRVDRYERPRPS